MDEFSIFALSVFLRDVPVKQISRVLSKVLFKIRGNAYSGGSLP